MIENSLKEIKDKQEAYESLLGDLGLKFLGHLHTAIKTAAMYEANNQRYIENATKLRETISSIFAENSDFTFTTKDDYFFLADIRLKVDKDNIGPANYFAERFSQLGIAGFSFVDGLDPAELDKFIYAFSGFSPSENIPGNFQEFNEKLNRLNIEKIAPVKFSNKKSSETLEGEENRDSTKTMARKTFFNAVAVVQETIAQAKNSNTVNLTKTKRVVQQLVNHIMDDPNALIELVSLRKFDDYTYVHSVNVCVLSLVLGFHIGLDRKRLSNLGVGALLHDIGKTKLPIELVNKPGIFDEYDWQMMRKHPVFGVKALLRTRPADETTARVSASIFEHHISYNGSGYPELPTKRKPSLFARIVAIADSYNAMTSGRIYHNRRHMPDETITNMVNRVGQDFDPLLLKVFINVMGIYPVGTVVALSSREIGIVSRTNPNDLEKPQVKVIANEGGLLDMSQVKVLDLSKEKDLYVTKMIDDDKYGIDVDAYINAG